MARTKDLFANQTVIVTAGPYRGQEATVVNPTAFDDDHPLRRRITLEIQGETVHLLPRLVEPINTSQAARAVAGGAGPVPVVTPLPVAQQAAQRPITDPMDPRLDSYRPDPKIVKDYINRTFAGNLTDTEILTAFFDRRKNVMLVGDTQSGKTMVVSVMAVLIAERLGHPKPLPVFTLSGSSGVTDFDLFGQTTAYTGSDGVERLVWLPGQVDLACRVGGILYLDEVNMMGERVTSSLHSVTDDRRHFVNRAKAVTDDGVTFVPEVVHAHRDLWVVGTMNAGYRGAGALNEAFANRFRHIDWGYDEGVEKRLIPSAAVRLLGDALRTARESRSITTPVGTTALVQLSQDVVEFGVEFALEGIVAAFPPHERERVEAIIDDRSIRTMLASDTALAREDAPSDPAV
jgi:MoxR-like ATPase